MQDLEDPYGEAWRYYGSSGSLIPSMDFQVMGWEWNEMDRNGWENRVEILPKRWQAKQSEGNSVQPSLSHQVLQGLSDPPD